MGSWTSISRKARGLTLGMRMGLMVGGTWGISAAFEMLLVYLTDNVNTLLCSISKCQLPRTVVALGTIIHPNFPFCGKPHRDLSRPRHY